MVIECKMYEIERSAAITTTSKENGLKEKGPGSCKEERETVMIYSNKVAVLWRRKQTCNWYEEGNENPTVWHTPHTHTNALHTYDAQHIIHTR